MSVYYKTRETKKAFTKISRKQRTIAKSVSIKGVGLFSAQPVVMTLHPAEIDTGVCFKRIDLVAASTLSAKIENLKPQPLCTILGNSDCKIVCVEHLLSAISASGIDNIIIELDAEEVPIFDGSAKQFIEMLEGAEVVNQEGLIEQWYLQKPIYIVDGDKQLIALPSNEKKFSYTLSYPGEPLLDAQFHCFEPSKDHYYDDIAPARTFSPLSSIKLLMEKGILKSNSLDHGVVIDGGKVLNPLGLRFINEMARHKILDMMGDLSLVGHPVVAHFIGIKSGHALNAKLSDMLRNMIMEEEPK